MRVEYINPFVETSYRVLKEVLGGAEVKRGNLYLKSTAMPVMGVVFFITFRYPLLVVLEASPGKI